jgi:2,4-dienoyl-CoA reductase-like NADH-dependent reductase (Old Yellow Enzyme family)
MSPFSRTADMFAFGRFYVANPDLVETATRQRFVQRVGSGDAL